MSFFKKLFGKKKPQKSNVSVELEQIEPIASKEMPKQPSRKELNGIYPFLTTLDWEGNINGNLSNVIYYNREEKPELLSILVHTEDSQLNQFGVVNTSEDNEEKFDNLYQTALVNLSKTEWAHRYFDDTDYILMIDQFFFATELILLKEQMLKIHRILESDKLFVAVPRRGLLLACPDGLNDEEKKTFTSLVSYIHSEEKFNENQLLAKDIFYFENGEIAGMLYAQ